MDRFSTHFFLTLRVLFSLVLCSATGYFVATSIHWQVVWDPAIMHYMHFLMDQGMAPYRDIIDINLPGSYLMEGWAMHVFGGGDLGWRFYDFFLLAVLTGSLVMIALPNDWFAGLYAGVIFTLLHGVEGSRNAGQREQVMITLIMVGYALLFTAMRRQQPLWMLAFGLFVGFAASLKPTAAPLGLILLLMMISALGRRRIPVKPYLTCGVLGMFAALVVSLNFLYQHRAFSDFLAISCRLVPYYAGVGNKPFLYLIKFLLPLVLSLPLLFGLLLVLVNKTIGTQERWERYALGVGILFGAASFLAQGKDFEHHAYTFTVFVLLWSALEFTRAMRRSGWVRSFGVASLAFGVLIVVPSSAVRLAKANPLAAQPNALERDLLRLGGTGLQHQVQCFDMVDGCFSTLYHLRLLPSTGFMGDFMFFPPLGSPPLPFYRELLWDDLHKNPPKVIVVTNMWLTEGNSFRKTDQWPELMTYLDLAYTVDVTRSFGASGYKIYVRKDGQERYLSRSVAGTSFEPGVRGLPVR